MILYVVLTGLRFVQALATLVRVEQIKRECKGEYDFASMWDRSGNYRILAEYKGPVEVERHGLRGGLFTTQAVAAGTLLFCTHAAAFCPSPLPPTSKKYAVGAAELQADMVHLIDQLNEKVHSPAGGLVTLQLQATPCGLEPSQVCSHHCPLV